MAATDTACVNGICGHVGSFGIVGSCVSLVGSTTADELQRLTVGHSLQGRPSGFASQHGITLANTNTELLDSVCMRMLTAAGAREYV